MAARAAVHDLLLHPRALGVVDVLEAIPAGDRVLGGGVVEPSVRKDDILLGVQGPSIRSLYLEDVPELHDHPDADHDCWS